MKTFNILLAMAIVFVLTSVNAYADTSMQVAIKLAQEKKVSLFVERINHVYEEINLYVFEQPDLSKVTPAFIQPRLSADAFHKYGAGDFSFTLEDNATVVFSGLIDAAQTSEVEKQMIKDAKNLNSFSMISDDVTSMRIPLKPDAYSYIKNKNSLDNNVDIIVSQTAPLDTSKLWYKPDGNGTFEIYHYVSGTWTLISHTSADNYTVSVVSTMAELNALSAKEGDSAYVIADGAVLKYIYSGSKWIKKAVSIKATIATGSCDASQIGSLTFNAGLNCIASCVLEDGTANWVCP